MKTWISQIKDKDFYVPLICNTHVCYIEFCLTYLCIIRYELNTKCGSNA